MYVIQNQLNLNKVNKPLFQCVQITFSLLQVNDENVDNMSTAEVIDLLRKIRGTIGITVLRKSGPNLQVSWLLAEKN